MRKQNAQCHSIKRVGTKLCKNNTYYGTITAINEQEVTLETPVQLPGFSDEPIIVKDEPSHRVGSIGVRAK